jgi:hypothetical protein
MPWPVTHGGDRRDIWQTRLAALLVFSWLFFRANTAVREAARTWGLFDPYDAVHGFDCLWQYAVAGVVAAVLFAAPLRRVFGHEATRSAFVIASPWIILTCAGTAFDLTRWYHEPWSQYLWLLEAVFPALLLMHACERPARVSRPRTAVRDPRRSAALATFLRGGAGLGRTTVAVVLALTFALALTRVEPAPPASLVTSIPLLDAAWEIALIAATLLLTLTTIALIRALRGKELRIGRWKFYGRNTEQLVAILLLAPAWVLTVFHAAPVIGASALDTFRMRPVPVWNIRYDDRARTIHLSGGYGPGVARDLVEYLAAHHEAVAVELSGPGGRLREGMEIAELIEKRGLSTIVNKRCASACTFAFAGGKERIVAGNGVLGFHASRGPSVLLEWLKDTNLEDAFRKQRGLDDQFIARANAVPCNAIWYPTHDELMAAGVVTAIR